MNSSPDPDPRHCAWVVVGLPPRSITCKCGVTFTGADPIGQQKAHMDALNPPQEER